LCSGSLNARELYTSGFVDYENLMALLESDEILYLEPSFIGADDVRLYKVRDIAIFSGTLTVEDALLPQVISDVMIRMEFGDSAYTNLDKNVMAVRVTTTSVTTCEETSTTTQMWQEDNGAFFELTDEYGIWRCQITGWAFRRYHVEFV
jgi:hypothetical protein